MVSKEWRRNVAYNRSEGSIAPFVIFKMTMSRNYRTQESFAAWPLTRFLGQSVVFPMLLQGFPDPTSLYNSTNRISVRPWKGILLSSCRNVQTFEIHRERESEGSVKSKRYFTIYKLPTFDSLTLDEAYLRKSVYDSLYQGYLNM